MYAPQESKTKQSEIEKMYYHIKKHKLQSEKMKEKILITGDFNCKIGNMIEGNTNEISKYGKIMLKTITDEDLVIPNVK